jgi:endonuclease/exonuclease/phosphatase family metal-dependent hydrolase
MNLLRRRPRLVFLALTLLACGAATQAGQSGPMRAAPIYETAIEGDADFSVMTYNVKGLPWPIARGRGKALEMIGEHLAAMRSKGLQPDIIVLQEAFVSDAKAIGKRAGYRYSALGPDERSAKADASGEEVERHWYLGETQGKQIDSGLVILSDHPIGNIRKAAFPTSDCAGYDCLAAKGLLLADIAIPNSGKVTIVTTHFNSYGASGASGTEADAAFKRQAEFFARVLAKEWNGSLPIIVAGDFNLGKRAPRAEAFAPVFDKLSGKHGLREALRMCITKKDCTFAVDAETQLVRDRALDMQFYADGERARLEPVGGSIPFPQFGGLSDHAGFTIAYRNLPTSEQLP